MDSGLNTCGDFTVALVSSKTIIDWVSFVHVSYIIICYLLLKYCG